MLNVLSRNRIVACRYLFDNIFRDLKDIYGGMIQFRGIQLLGLILIITFPQIALWLPTYL